MNITVYLGAHEGNDPSYRKAVEELGAWIAGNGNRLVYGGSDEGMVGRGQLMPCCHMAVR